MPEMIFSCGCGMTLKVMGDGRPGRTADCPSCGESNPVPAFGQPEPAFSGPVPDLEPEPETRSAGQENFAIIFITLAFLLSVGAIVFVLIPALRGSKGESPDGTLASAASNGDESVSRSGRGQSTGGEGSSGPDHGGPSEPLPNYSADAPAPRPATPPIAPPIFPRNVPKPALPAKVPAPNPAPKKAVPPSPKPDAAKAKPKPKTKPAAPPSLAATKLAAANRLEEAGKKQEALDAFKRLAEEFPGTIESGYAQTHIDKLKRALTPGKPQSSPEHGGSMPRG